MRTKIRVFIAVKSKFLNILAALKFAKTQNEPKPAKTKKCNPQRPVFPYHVHNKADFDNPFISGRGFTSFTF